MEEHLLLKPEYNKIYSKEQLNEYVSDEEIMLYFYGDFHINSHNKCPFKPERIPSFYIKYTNEKLVWTRYGMFDNRSFNVIVLVMKLEGLNFQEALNHIYNEMCIKNKNKINKERVIELESKKYDTIKNEKKIQYSDKWDKDIYLKYWKDYHFYKSLLIKHDVYPLYRLWINNKVWHQWSNTDPFYLYYHDKNENIWTSYRPIMSEKEHTPFTVDTRFRKNNTRGHVMGLNLCQKSTRRDIGFITSSKKDIMALDILGYDAIAPHSESGWNYNEFLEAVMFMKRHYKYVYVAFDNDETGVTQSIEITRMFGLYYWNVPIEEGGDDPSSFIKQTNPEYVRKNIENKFKRDGIW